MNESNDDGDRDSKSRSRRKNEGEDEFTMFLKMLEKSEARIDRTNVMISRLVDACKSVENAYTSHVGSLQSSRDTSQKNNAKLIALLDRVTKRRAAAPECAFRKGQKCPPVATAQRDREILETAGGLQKISREPDRQPQHVHDRMQQRRICKLKF